MRFCASGCPGCAHLEFLGATLRKHYLVNPKPLTETGNSRILTLTLVTLVTGDHGVGDVLSTLKTKTATTQQGGP